MKKENKISKKKRWLYTGLTTIIFFGLMTIGTGIVYRLTHEPVKGNFFIIFTVTLCSIVIIFISVVLYSIYKKTFTLGDEDGN